MPKRLHYSVRMRASREGLHVSGAEGIFDKHDVSEKVRDFSRRAFVHDKGRANEVRIIVEELEGRPKKISSLPLCTVNTRNPESARKTAFKILSSVGITERAFEEAYKSLTIGIAMRGAMLMNVEGVRLEPDLLRGVRVTRMGITKRAASGLARQLGRLNLNNDTVKEALILSSKVIRYRMVLGELCISDDPNYTTGYVATRNHGYVRLPRIKKRGVPYGGRVFFITGGEVKDLIQYLQKTPVMLDVIKPCKGVLSIKELLERKSRR